MSTFAAFALFLIGAAFTVNVLRGTGRQWLLAKFTGKATT